MNFKKTLTSAGKRPVSDGDAPVYEMAFLPGASTLAIHIFRTGGTSVNQAFRALGGTTLTRYGESATVFKIMQELLDAPGVFKASIVRHPVDRALSSFHALEKRDKCRYETDEPEPRCMQDSLVATPGMKKEWLEEFERYLDTVEEWQLAVEEKKAPNPHFVPQARFLVNRDGEKYRMDYLGRTTMLAEDIKFTTGSIVEVRERHGPCPDTLMYRLELSDLPDATLRRLCRIYLEDFLCFGHDLPLTCQAAAA